MIDIRSVASALGGKVIGRSQVLVPGPGHSPRDRSLSVWLGQGMPDGFVVYSHCGDDLVACRDHIRRLLALPAWSYGGRQCLARAERLPVRPQTSPKSADDGRRRIAVAMRIWRETVPPPDTLLETYLKSRGLVLPDAVVAGGHLRFHPACPFRVEDRGTLRLPAMVCLMTDPLTAKPKAVHRTALRRDGSGKANLPGGAKWTLGIAGGAVVRLCPDECVTLGLGLSEGIENGIAALCQGWSPVWAAGSAGNMAVLSVLPGIEALTLFADPGAAGEKAATACGSRWAEAGRNVEVRYPSRGDWNDAVREHGT